MSDKPMMECGHAANAKNTKTGLPSCCICVGLHPGAERVAQQPDLAQRESECAYCRKKKPSTTNLPFFEHRPSKPTDLHYDGCRGWD